jgi:hypothetical protein
MRKEYILFLKALSAVCNRTQPKKIEDLKEIYRLMYKPMYEDIIGRANLPKIADEYD